jgi:asparagine synthase (glutamine-hydrolysing)
MCGILGWLKRDDAAIDVTAFQQALDLIRHRGPDGEGYLLYGANNAPPTVAAGRDTPAELRLPLVQGLAAQRWRLALGHRRLSILDLSAAGHQPMCAPSGSHWIVFNGEIYNYVELRTELAKLGHRFKTGSDTEVLLAAYESWGEALLPRLIGMFAFAVLDLAKQALFLARDPFGIKPLYLAESNCQLAFGSEIRPLLALGAASRQIHHQATYHYLRYGDRLVGDTTMFRDVRCLPAGCSMWVPLDRVRASDSAPMPVRYWRASVRAPQRLGFDDAVGQVRQAFDESVRMHLRSDVPVGTCLSGGLDSSSIALTARSFMPAGSEFHAFTFVANDESISEKPYADLVAGVVHHEVCPGDADLERDLQRLMQAQELPFGSSSIYAQFRVFELAHRAGIKVMLDGQGADEVFGGYLSLLGARIAGLLSQGRVLAAARLVRAAPGNARAALPRMLLAALGRLLPAGMAPWARSIVGEQAAPQWLSQQWLDAAGVKATLPNYGRGRYALRAEMQMAIETLSLPQLLRYEDLNSMHFSIESRVPFCVPRLAELALSFPDEFLISRGGVTKSVFREAMVGRVPDAIIHREKVGFLPPERKWLAALQPLVDRTLDGSAFAKLPFFDPQRVRDSYQREIAARGLWPQHLWRILNLCWWIEHNKVAL